MNTKPALLHVCACVLIGVTFLPSTTHAATIARQFQKHVPQIVDYLNEHNYKTVGVLKFRVKKPGERPSDKAGPLTSLLADRLEIALVLGNPFDKSRQLKIIKDASAQVERIPGANHLTAEGQKACFGAEYELSWGGEKGRADAFITGVVDVSDDGGTATVHVLVVGNETGKFKRACDSFEAELDASSLSEMGESFVLRGAFDGGTTKLTKNQQQKVKQEKVQEAVQKVKKQLTKFPLKDTSAPVRLEVTYDGNLMTVETRDGKAFLPEPKQGQDVQMTLIRGNSAKGTLAVVLRVNGENTIGRQTVSDLECRKWLLTESHTRTVVRGYQIDGKNEIEKFVVLSDEESKKRAVDYGRHFGQIQVTVFKEFDQLDADDLPDPLPDEDEEDLVALLRGVRPSQPSRDLGELKRQIRSEDGTIKTRGILDGGEREENKVKTIKFEEDPTPVMAATITYYTK